ncbi:MAG TPA: pyridoxal kinase PdxY [Stellaceae bacterium]|jgi:pyridoxine kinase|nr:pyridoxal kinase PdxY [Stellaceae bacterium]
MPAILSIQSWVAYGHVGNAAAMFPLQRLGFEVMAVNTVQFSNHTGYGAWRGEVFGADAVREVITGIGERGAFADCAAVLTGYAGDPAIGQVMLDAVAEVRAANPGVLWCCDPVMGDIGTGFYVRTGLPEYFRDRAVPQADIATPNQFELEYLTGIAIKTLDDVLEAVAALRRMGPKTVLVTSLRHDEVRPGHIEMLAADDAGAWAVATPELPISVNGAGDAVAALFLGHCLRAAMAPGRTGKRNMRLILGNVASAIHAVLETTVQAQASEIQLVAAQDALIRTEPRFQPVFLGKVD